MSDIFKKALGDLGDDLVNDLKLRGFGLDEVNFSWVPLFLADQKERTRIESLTGQIQEIGRKPIAREELREALVANLKAFREARQSFLRVHLEKVQKHEADLLSTGNAFSYLNWPVLASFLNFDLGNAEIDALFEGLEPGVTTAEKEAETARLRGLIEEAEIKIREELSPPERWIYTPSGNPIRYPRGCRWTAYVKTWRMIAARCSEPVTVDGYKLESEAEKSAYYALKLDQVRKETPLREGKPLHLRASRHKSR